MFHLLYLDDDLIDRMSLTRMVSHVPYIEVVAVGTIAEAMHYVNQHYVDCVLTDYNLPEAELTDVETIAGDVPLIVLSGAEIPEPIEHPAILKPVSLESLNQTLLTLFARLGPSFSLDLDYLNTIADGEAAFVQEIFDVFKREVPEELAELKNAVFTKDWGRAAFHIHKLKSRVRILGLHELKKLSDELEPKFKHETDLLNAEDLVRQFISSMECVLIEIYRNEPAVSD